MSRKAVIGLGIALIVVAGVLLAVTVPRLTRQQEHPARAAALVREGCAAFDDVYQATRPGTPTDGEVLARRLETAIDRIDLAAKNDASWRLLADAVTRAGTAVNAGDTASAADAFRETHERCALAAARSG